MCAVAAEVQSCFYEGRLWHRRRTPVRHQFTQQVMMAYIDLEELEAAREQRGGDSQLRSALSRFRRGDHLGPADLPLGEAVRTLVDQQLNWRPQGPIRLLTNLPSCGFRMNPLSLFYCFAEDGVTLQACVAEVTNTPWNERHHYVLDLRNQSTRGLLTAGHAKELHVSPFFDMDMRYRWQLRVPGERLQVHLQNIRGEERLFDAVLTMRRVPISRLQAWRLAVRYPLQTVQVYAAIHWQALRLWLRGVPYVPHPPPRTGLTPSEPVS